MTATWVDITGNSDYAGTVVGVSPGSHNIHNRVPAHPFMAIAYGNAPYNSYAYAAGTRLGAINLPCSPSGTVPGDGIDNDCDGMIDEETDNGIDDDGDSPVDEDVAFPPRIDGQWGDWASWGSCSSVYGSLPGTKSMTRNCDNLAPANYGLDCDGSATDSVSCTVSTPCPIDGHWGDWAAWGSCSVVCGSIPGIKERTQNCDNPAPAHSGDDFVGSGTESIACTASVACPKIHGGWSNWGAWSTCSVTCGLGDQNRQRSCDSPSPQYGGNDCAGSGVESNICKINSYCLPSFYGNLDLGCDNTTEFGCATGGIKCIDITFRCDSLLDCDDASDESDTFAGCTKFSSKSSSGHVYGSLLQIGLNTAMLYMFKTASF